MKRSYYKLSELDSDVQNINISDLVNDILLNEIKNQREIINKILKKYRYFLNKNIILKEEIASKERYIANLENIVTVRMVKNRIYE